MIVTRLPALVVVAALLVPSLGTAVTTANAQATAPTELGAAGADQLDPIEARRLLFLFWAYAAFWILLAIYLVSLSFRLRTVQQELRRATDRLERAGGSAAEAGPSVPSQKSGVVS